MKVKLRCFGGIRTAVGSREIILEVPEQITLHGLFRLFESEYPQIPLSVYEEDGFRRRFRVLINGRDTFTLQGTDTVLVNGDIVAVFPLIVGG
ncbi:MAG: MoaD/ThiS family protein [Anaerolineales bacterium]|nr:MAG: MoaD/ThiS family protein [Anaerolineales bacterium]